MINFKNKDSKRVSEEWTKKPQNKQKHPTKTRQTRKEKLSSIIYSVTKPLALFSPRYMDAASIECRDSILPLKKAQQTNKQNKAIKENTHTTKPKANKQTKKPKKSKPKISLSWISSRLRFLFEFWKSLISCPRLWLSLAASVPIDCWVSQIQLLSPPSPEIFLLDQPNHLQISLSFCCSPRSGVGQASVGMQKATTIWDGHNKAPPGLVRSRLIFDFLGRTVTANHKGLRQNLGCVNEQNTNIVNPPKESGLC